ncbi:MAG: CHASE3 domain-containing protein [Stygiobacter sp.]
MKKSSLLMERIVKLGFVLTISIFILVSIITYHSFNQLINSAHEVDETIHKLHDLDYLHALLADAETGERGFILTGMSSYLQPYWQAIDSVNLVMKRLNKIILNPEQQNKLDTLSVLISAKLNELGKTISVYRNKGSDAAERLIISNQGKIIMDKIRFVLNRIRYYEKERLAQYSVERSEMRRRTVYNLIGSLLLEFLISAATIVLLHNNPRFVIRT